MKTIDGKKMKELLEAKKVRAIDIDAAQDFKKNHIKGAINIPFEDKQFVQKVQKQFAKKNENVVLCGKTENEKHMSQLARDLEKVGYQNIYQYQGGPDDWKSSGLTVQRQA